MEFLLKISRKKDEDVEVFLGTFLVDPKKDSEERITLSSVEGSTLQILLQFDEESDTITVRDPLGPGEAIFIVGCDDTLNPFGNSFDGEISIGPIPTPPPPKGFEHAAVMV